MTAPLEWEQVIDTIDGWPLDHRVLLMRHLLDMLVGGSELLLREKTAMESQGEGAGVGGISDTRRRRVVGPDPRLQRTPDELEEIMTHAVHRLHTGRPPPNDDDVRQILDDARLEKYR